jgi:N-methylhydantoinase B
MASNQSNVPIEMIEIDYPIRIARYGLVPDSGGAGQFRGGLSLIREYEVLADDLYFGVRSDKRAFPPHGLAGGSPGQPSWNIINPGANARLLPTLGVHPTMLGRGDVFRHTMAGAGGYGDPLTRDPALVREDLLDGKITERHAQSAYGVIFTDSPTRPVDERGTRELRAEMARHRSEPSQAIAGL